MAGSPIMGATVTSSGFLIASKGYILTTYHTIEGADPASGITVEFNTDTRRRAQLIEEDAVNDVALLKVDMTGVSTEIRPLDLGNSRTVSVGDSVMTIANPFGLQRTLASGIVSALQTQLTGVGGMGISDVLQTDIPSSPGADGGPLMDTDGDVIGINSQIEVPSGGSTSAVGFAVPIDTVTGSHGIVQKGVLP
jgi:S1-C subfamily serine protease